jgi:hypothetical protein
MRDPRQGDPTAPDPLATEDARTEEAVLAFVLTEHPAQLTVGELTLALSGGSRGFAESDAVKCAVHDLAGAGLLHCHGDFVLPTRAALRFSRIDPHPLL